MQSALSAYNYQPAECWADCILYRYRYNRDLCRITQMYISLCHVLLKLIPVGFTDQVLIIYNNDDDDGLLS